MFNSSLRRISLICLSAVVFVIVFEHPLMAQQKDAHASADAHSMVGDKGSIEQAREKLKNAEAAHPEGSLEEVHALNELVYALEAFELVNAESNLLVERELLLAEKLSGPEGLESVDALVQKSYVLSHNDKRAEARPIIEKALEIIRRKYSDKYELPFAARELMRICTGLGDYPCALREADESINAIRKGAGASDSLSETLSQRAELKYFLNDLDGAIVDIGDALSLAYKNNTSAFNLGILERNLADMYIRAQKYDQAMPHLERAKELMIKAQGADGPELKKIEGLAANMYSRTGQFEKAWKSYLIALENKGDSPNNLAAYRSSLAGSYAAGGDLKDAVELALQVEKSARETFVLQARTLPERQALSYSQHHPSGINIFLSVIAKHPELPKAEIYQEVVRSRGLVADEMARRQKNLNASNDPEVAKELEELNKARLEVLNAEKAGGGSESTAQATTRMEKIERDLAVKSAAIRNDVRIYDVQLDEIRRRLPAHSVLISYVAFKAIAVEKVDPARSMTPSYLAFLLSADTNEIHVFALGEAKPIDDLISEMRASSDAEAHSGGMGSTRNERAYREAALKLRERIWDPLAVEIAKAKLVLVVPDGMLNLVPFSSLPDGDGYLVERKQVVHILTSERDLVPSDVTEKKQGLLAIGSPAFELAVNNAAPATLRGEQPSCDAFSKTEFAPLPGAKAEVAEIGSEWKQWNGAEGEQLITGDDATLGRFIADSPHNRVLHVATHAFVLDKSCGGGNPLLHSGLVFAGANKNHEGSILTAQQIASLDLSGVDWAVLSACNTGVGELHDGEGVLGLQRAFRVAGAHSVVMSLWPVGDEVTQRFMSELYKQRLSEHATTADALWTSARKLLKEQRAAGKSTHPWYWAGFVGSGGWE
jgi:CHAT domain-containing protein